jgi:peptidoglycan/LPS O-acetylase OafA/YrhL
MKLSNFTHGRDNNFNLIRIVAAYAVLVTHSFALVTGTEYAEPFRNSIGMTMGSIAVDIFFVTSGFLVTASLLTRQFTIDFLWARILRIYPALCVMLLLTVFGLGLFYTTNTWTSYLANNKTYEYFWRCLTLFTGVEYKLPGVFESNPYKGSVNGSLWTLPYEIKMYAILAIIWIFLRVLPHNRAKAFKITICFCALFAGLLVVLAHFNLSEHAIVVLPGLTGSRFTWLFYMFFTGAAFFVLKDWIILSHALLIICVVALILATFNQQLFSIVYVSTLAYVLFYIAYIPSGLIRKYNKLGDYSYGVYIYAFPVQQSIVALVSGTSVFLLVFSSTIITFACAALSWHFLEKHAMKLKGGYVTLTKKFLSHGLTITSIMKR